MWRCVTINQLAQVTRVACGGSFVWRAISHLGERLAANNSWLVTSAFQMKLLSEALSSEKYKCYGGELIYYNH